jgi:hypothetical protein
MESQVKTKKHKLRQAGRIACGILAAALIIFLYIRYYFVFGEGVKSGQLNYVVYKGYLFKTYEGKLIQAGFRSGEPGSPLRSNEFIFSVTDPAVAEKLMLAGGREVDLHYREYFATLPWRGYSPFVVDSIIEIK